MSGRSDCPENRCVNCSLAFGGLGAGGIVAAGCEGKVREIFCSTGYLSPEKGECGNDSPPEVVAHKVGSILSTIFKLDYIPDEEGAGGGDGFDGNMNLNDISVCRKCSDALAELWKYYMDFLKLGEKESYLAKKISQLEDIIDRQIKPAESSVIQLRQDIFDNDDNESDFCPMIINNNSNNNNGNNSSQVSEELIVVEPEILPPSFLGTTEPPASKRRKIPVRVRSSLMAEETLSPSPVSDVSADMEDDDRDDDRDAEMWTPEIHFDQGGEKDTKMDDRASRFGSGHSEEGEADHSDPSKVVSYRLFSSYRAKVNQSKSLRPRQQVQAISSIATNILSPQLGSKSSRRKSSVVTRKCFDSIEFEHGAAAAAAASSSQSSITATLDIDDQTDEEVNQPRILSRGRKATQQNLCDLSSTSLLPSPKVDKPNDSTPEGRLGKGRAENGNAKEVNGNSSSSQITKNAKFPVEKHTRSAASKVVVEQSKRRPIVRLSTRVREVRMRRAKMDKCYMDDDEEDGNSGEDMEKSDGPDDFNSNPAILDANDGIPIQPSPSVRNTKTSRGSELLKQDQGTTQLPSAVQATIVSSPAADSSNSKVQETLTIPSQNQAVIATTSSKRQGKKSQPSISAATEPKKISKDSVTNNNPELVQDVGQSSQEMTPKAGRTTRVSARSSILNVNSNTPPVESSSAAASRSVKIREKLKQVKSKVKHSTMILKKKKKETHPPENILLKRYCQRRLKVPYPCWYCKLHFKSAHEVIEHTKDKHSNSSEDHVCDRCGKISTSPKAYKIHSKSCLPAVKENEPPTAAATAPTPTALPAVKDFHGKGSKSRQNCPICLKPVLKTSLQAHLNITHSDNRPFPCPFCDYKAKTPYRLNIHKEKIHKELWVAEKREKQQQAKKSLKPAAEPQSTEANVQQQAEEPQPESSSSQPPKKVARVVPEKPFPCDVCDYKGTTKHRLLLHKKQCHGEGKDMVKCNQCNQEFVDKHVLSQHIRDSHDSEGRTYRRKLRARYDQSLEEDKGGDGASQVDAVKDAPTTSTTTTSSPINPVPENPKATTATVIHVAKREPPPKVFYCKECNNNFDSKYRLQRHQMSEHGFKKPTTSFKCQKCTKGFFSEDSLRIHVDTIHGVGNHLICSVCKKEFVKTSTLKTHMMHIHAAHYTESPTPFGCHKCNIAFADVSGLRDHSYVNCTAPPPDILSANESSAETAPTPSGMPTVAPPTDTLEKQLAAPVASTTAAPVAPPRAASPVVKIKEPAAPATLPQMNGLEDQAKASAPVESSVNNPVNNTPESIHAASIILPAAPQISASPAATTLTSPTLNTDISSTFMSDASAAEPSLESDVSATIDSSTQVDDDTFDSCQSEAFDSSAPEGASVLDPSEQEFDPSTQEQQQQVVIIGNFDSSDLGAKNITRTSPSLTTAPTAVAFDISGLSSINGGFVDASALTSHESFGSSVINSNGTCYDTTSLAADGTFDSSTALGGAVDADSFISASFHPSSNSACSYSAPTSTLTNNTANSNNNGSGLVAPETLSLARASTSSIGDSSSGSSATFLPNINPNSGFTTFAVVFTEVPQNESGNPAMPVKE